MLLGRELEQESSGSLEDVHRISVEPVLELVFPALDEDGHHVVPIIGSQQGRIVGHLEQELLSFESALHLDLALMLVQGRWILDVLASD